MNTPVKALIGLGAVSGVAGGGYLIGQQLSTKSISDKLKDDKYEILEDGSGEWGNILTQYKLVVAENSDLKFENVTITTEEGLKGQCKKVLTESSSNINSYKRGAKWCTVPRDMKSMLKSKGYRALSTDNSKDNIDQNLWNTNIRKHNDKTNNADKKFTFTGKSDNQLTESLEDRNKIRDMCRPLGTKKHYEQNFETDLEKATLWCSELN